MPGRMQTLADKYRATWVANGLPMENGEPECEGYLWIKNRLLTEPDMTFAQWIAHIDRRYAEGKITVTNWYGAHLRLSWDDLHSRERLKYCERLERMGRLKIALLHKSKFTETEATEILAGLRRSKHIAAADLLAVERAA